MTSKGVGYAGNTVFIDSSAYFALFEKREVNHKSAAAILSKIQSEGLCLVTSNFMLAETHAPVLNRINSKVAFQFLKDTLYGGSTTVIRVTPEDEQQAEQILIKYHDKNFTLVDATSFAVMERLNISKAFTFDKHFSQYGWTILTP